MSNERTGNGLTFKREIRLGDVLTIVAIVFGLFVSFQVAVNRFSRTEVCVERTAKLLDEIEVRVHNLEFWQIRHQALTDAWNDDRESSP